MKLVSTVIIIFCAISFNACKKDKTDQTDTRKPLLVKMTTTKVRFVYEYDQQNRLVSETFYRAATPTEMDYKETYSEFNAAGQPVKITVTGDESVASGTAVYDGQNRIVKITYYNATSVAVSSQNFVYSGNTVEQSVRNERIGAVSGKEVYTFNNEGNIVSREIYSISGSVVQRLTNKTFDSKKSVREFYYPVMGINFSVNNVSSSETTVTGSGQVYQFTYNNEYNEEGYPVKITTKNVTLGQESIITYGYIKK